MTSRYLDCTLREVTLPYRTLIDFAARQRSYTIHAAQDSTKVPIPGLVSRPCECKALSRK